MSAYPGQNLSFSATTLSDKHNSGVQECLPGSSRVVARVSLECVNPCNPIHVKNDINLIGEHRTVLSIILRKHVRDIDLASVHISLCSRGECLSAEVYLRWALRDGRPSSFGTEALPLGLSVSR